MSMDATTEAPADDHAAHEAPAPGDEMPDLSDSPASEKSDAEIESAVEALLIVADRPTPPARLADAVGLGEGGPARVDGAVERLNTFYADSGRAFRIERVAGGLRIMTRPEHARAVAALKGARNASRLSKAAVETLAIIAYKQPITRSRLESIRGVACGEVLKSLMDRRLITITGRAEELGRPMLYGTTKPFLETFGLASLKDLPTVAELGMPPVLDGAD